MRARMSTRFNRAYLLVPVIYVGVIFGLLFLQFSGGERVTRSIGSLALSAARATANEDGTSGVRELAVSFEGLEFQFTEDSGLIVETSTGFSDLYVTDYQIGDDAIDVFFGDTTVLRFQSDNDNKELQIRLSLLTVPDNLVEIAIPFSLAVGAVASQDRGAFVTVEHGGSEYYFSAPARAQIDLDNGKIVLHSSVVDQMIRYVKAQRGDPAAVAAMFADPALAIGQTAYDEAIERYVDHAYTGWSTGRYRSSEVAWVSGAARTEFGEATLVAYLAEAWRRDDYERAYAEMRRARDIHPEQLTLASAPFLGNLLEIIEQTVVRDEELSATIAERIASDDPTFFRYDEIFAFLKDRAAPGLLDRVVDFANHIEADTIDLLSAASLLSGVRDAVRLGIELNDELAQQLSDALLGSVVKADGLFLVESSPGQCDVYLSVRAGVALLDHGSSIGDETLSSAGRQLMVSALSFGDENSTLPATLMLRDGTIESAEGEVTAESLYHYLVENPNYPHHVSLSDELAPGVWAYAAVPLTVSSASSSTWRLQLSYPRLRTHYIVLNGVPEFSRMELFGQTWRDAPDFEIYSKGRHFVPATGSLLIKYYDDSTQRDMVLYF
jgi:hypothetical protein